MTIGDLEGCTATEIMFSREWKKKQSSLYTNHYYISN